MKVDSVIGRTLLSNPVTDSEYLSNCLQVKPACKILYIKHNTKRKYRKFKEKSLDVADVYCFTLYFLSNGNDCFILTNKKNTSSMRNVIDMRYFIRHILMTKFDYNRAIANSAALYDITW